MEPIFQKNFEITDLHVDRYDRLLPSKILYFAQEVAGMDSTDQAESLAAQNLFWAVARHRVQVSRLPKLGETVRIETWPMPTTRVAYPRNMVAYDQEGRECFRSITLWVLMNLDTRKMITPGKSGIVVAGTLRGGELPSPAGLIIPPMGSHRERTVCLTDLDRNGHMNNTRYMDWIYDLLPSAFHAGHAVKEFTVCYLSEATEGQRLNLSWDLDEENTLQVDAHRLLGDKEERVFSARLLFG